MVHMSWIVLVAVCTCTCVRPIIADIDYSICNPINVTLKPPPPPGLPPSFSSQIEWKWLDHNITVDVTETYNGIINISSQSIIQEGHTTQLLFDFQEQQLATYYQSCGGPVYNLMKGNQSCAVRGIGTIVYHDGKVWLTPIAMLYGVVKRAEATYIGETTIRSTRVNHWRSCLYLYEQRITMQIDMYFTVVGWAMALSDPGQMVPVRFEINGSTLVNTTLGSLEPFHAIGDFIYFDPKPSINEMNLQLPPGVFCPKRASRKPFDFLPKSFSLVYEVLQVGYRTSTITYEYIWFNVDKRLARLDSKKALGNDFDPRSNVFDFNLGARYSMDTYVGTCSKEQITIGSTFVTRTPASRITMQTSNEFFHVISQDIQYVGTRTTRGVTCDVWIGRYLDPSSNINNTIEWYFTKSDWQLAIGRSVHSASLFRIDIWQKGTKYPIVRNVLQMDIEPPTFEKFDVSICFTASHRVQIVIRFSVINGGDISTVSLSYMRETLHKQLVTAALLPPLRITSTSVDYSGSNVYFRAILLDKAPVVNTKLDPPPPHQHTLEGAFEFLGGVVKSKLKINLTSTTLKFPVTIQTMEIYKVNYSKDFTTTPHTTIPTTKEITPPPPDLSPATIKPLTPTIETPPLPPLTTTPTPTTQGQTLTPVTCPPLSCPTNPLMTHVTCPTQKPCPSPPTRAPCPILTRITCPPHNCPTTTPCPACPTRTCPTVTCPPPRKVTPAKCPPTPKPPTPCPSKSGGIVTQSTPVSSATGTPGNPLKSTGNGDPSSGVSGGLAAGIAVITLVLGLIFGMCLLRVFQKYGPKLDPDGKFAFARYLDDENKY